MEQVRVVETGSGETVWSMDGPVLLYTSPPFVWSPDGAYVSVAYAGRTWRDGLVVDVKNRTAQPLPGMAELAPLLPDTTPDGDRPDPYIDPLLWLEDRKLLVSFSWRVQEDIEDENGRVSGRYEFHVDTGEITLLDEGENAP